MSVARDYVDTILTTFGMVEGGSGEQAAIWRAFAELATEYTEVDWEESRRLAKYFRAVPRGCFQNAARIAFRKPGLLYCEGFAAALIPVEHAWLIDPVRQVVLDPTWCLLEERAQRATSSYFGVTITAAVLRQHDRDSFQPSWLPLAVKKAAEMAAQK